MPPAALCAPPPDAPGCPCACHSVAHRDGPMHQVCAVASPPTGSPCHLHATPLACLHACWCEPSLPLATPKLAAGVRL